mmetsp:Transcript_4680/g.8503  ORF Transcript_4680/g.8503 Transcript_4680/m.8503 type:complete len:372 (+) Transcript_4680:317-1432(+)
MTGRLCSSSSNSSRRNWRLRPRLRTCNSMLRPKQVLATPLEGPACRAIRLRRQALRPDPCMPTWNNHTSQHTQPTCPSSSSYRKRTPSPPSPSSTMQIYLTHIPITTTRTTATAAAAAAARPDIPHTYWAHKEQATAITPKANHSQYHHNRHTHHCPTPPFNNYAAAAGAGSLSSSTSLDSSTQSSTHSSTHGSTHGSSTLSNRQVEASYVPGQRIVSSHFEFEMRDDGEFVSSHEPSPRDPRVRVSVHMEDPWASDFHASGFTPQDEIQDLRDHMLRRLNARRLNARKRKSDESLESVMGVGSADAVADIGGDPNACDNADKEETDDLCDDDEHQNDEDEDVGACSTRTASSSAKKNKAKTNKKQKRVQQ